MKKQQGYTILLVLTILCTLAAVSTLIPQETASKECFMGYKAHCTAAPLSTIICLILAGVSCRVRSKKFKRSE
ncbi:MAG: hypothetical protein JXR76_32565 [Deltaproteobacteria bacterium]|nr:hypothetical protein [Deltaproteobacteria bacterium]